MSNGNRLFAFDISKYPKLPYLCCANANDLQRAQREKDDDRQFQREETGDIFERRVLILSIIVGDDRADMKNIVKCLTDGLSMFRNIFMRQQIVEIDVDCRCR